MKRTMIGLILFAAAGLTANAGVVKAVVHPVKTAKATAKAVKKTGHIVKKVLF